MYVISRTKQKIFKDLRAMIGLRVNREIGEVAVWGESVGEGVGKEILGWGRSSLLVVWGY